MINKEQIYEKAFENKKTALQNKEKNREIMLAAAYESESRLSEIDNTMSRIGASLAITALSGNAEQIAELKKISTALSEEKKLLLKKAQVPEIVFDCPLCSDTGYLGGKICECIKREASSILAGELSREMPLGECTFDRFELKYYPETDQNGKKLRKKMSGILDFCKEYANSFEPIKSANLLFMGKTGLGKTHLSLAIVSEIIKKGFAPIYGSAENLFSAVTAEKFRSDGNETYNALLNCDLLVIDDLGTEAVTSITKSMLYNIVNTRIMTRRPTIISTNLGIEEIDDMYTQRITSRFMGSYEAFEFSGVDIRQQKRLEQL